MTANYGFTKVNAYGDSITTGYGLPSPSTQNWASVFAANSGLTLLNNYAQSGDRMYDAGEIVAAYANTPATDTASVIIPGANDDADYPIPSNRPFLVDGYRAFAAWLALPTAQKITVGSIVFSSGWSSFSEFGMAGRYHDATGATATGTVSGTAVYIAGWVAQANARTIEIRVDGVLKDTIATNNPLSGAIAYPYCYRISGLSAGSHSVEVKLTATGVGAVSVQWMGGNGTLNSAGPFVGIGATLPYNNVTYSGYITALNVLTSAMCSELSSDGLNVLYIDDNTILTLGATDFQQTGTPNLHPTVVGAGKIAAQWGLVVPHTSSISGNAGVSDTTVSYSGASSGSVIADSSGNYTITGLGDGSYTITPSKTGWVFTPAILNETVSAADISGANFVATSTGTFIVSGRVKGTRVYESGTILTTPPTFGNVINWTPAPAHFGDVDNAPVDNSNPVSWSPTPPHFCDKLPSTGATVTLSGAASGSTTTDQFGNYSFGSLAAGTYTVTPTQAGYTFAPLSRTFTINDSVNGINFTSN